MLKSMWNEIEIIWISFVLQMGLIWKFISVSNKNSTIYLVLFKYEIADFSFNTITFFYNSPKTLWTPCALQRKATKTSMVTSMI